MVAMPLMSIDLGELQVGRYSVARAWQMMHCIRLQHNNTRVDNATATLALGNIPSVRVGEYSVPAPVPEFGSAIPQMKLEECCVCTGPRTEPRLTLGWGCSV